jgi:hypothetical protein
LAIIFARVSLILINLGFWIGSLWGDYLGETWAQGRRLPAMVLVQRPTASVFESGHNLDRTNNDRALAGQIDLQVITPRFL